MACSEQPFLQSPSPSPGNKPCGQCDSLPHSLPELLNDCFQHAIDKDSLSSKRTDCVEQFHRYMTELHCQENLLFIIEIFRYRYYYEKRYPEAEEEKPISASYVHHSLGPLIQSLPHPAKIAKKHYRKTSFKSQSNVSLSSATGAPFDLEFDDVADKQSAWRYLSDQYLRNTDSESSSDLDDFDDDTMISYQWNYILDNFIYNKSPCQVNLTNQTFHSLVDKSALELVHSPSELMDAYCEVLDLIHENVYCSFLQKFRCPPKDPASPTSDKNDMPSSAESGSCRVVSGPKSASKITSPGCADKAEVPGSVKSGGHMIAPVPSKKRSKFLSTFSSSSSSEGSPVPNALGQFLGHLMPQSSSRLAYSAPQSPLSHPHASRETSPTFKIDEEMMIPRSRSTMVPDESHSSSFINKLWKKKK